MDIDASPNPPPHQKHPFHVSLANLSPSFNIPIDSPLPQPSDGSAKAEINSANFPNIPTLIITESTPPIAKGEVNDDDDDDESPKELLGNVVSGPNVSADSMAQPSQVTSEIGATLPINSALLCQTSAKKLKYQTKAMYEKSVGWIKKVKTILKDSPLMLFGLASKYNPKPDEVIEQSKIIFEDFLYIRLREAGFGFEDNNGNDASPNFNQSHTKYPSKDVNSYRLNPSLGSSSDSCPKPILSVWQKGNGETYEHWHAEYVCKLSTVSAELHNIGMKLETTYTSLYKNVSTQVCMSPIKNEAQCRRIIVSIGDTMFKNGIVTWARVVAIFSLASAIAIECFNNKEPRLIQTVMSSVLDVMDKHVVEWIVLQGGWTDVTRAYREMNQETRTLWALLGIGASMGFAFMWVTSQQW